jgi:peptidoglycan/LPS O-acetylase OafA/YrhL
MFTHPNTPSNYRPDVDGLRAVAVLLVVFFHAFPEYLSGGYIGVDVFFVISGFLISGIIFRKLDAGCFSFFDFYARRVRRIFPALIFLFVLLLAAGALLLTASEYLELGREVIWGTFFAENIYLIKNTGGYWDLATEMMPLMHLWTLAVEEQYYIFYPILSLLIFRLWKKGRGAVLWALWLASFAFCLFQYTAHPIGTFFSLHTRFWELCSGCLLAYYFPVVEKRLQEPSCRFIGEVLPWAGLAVILVSAFLLTGEDRYPGALTLLPVLGSAAVICGTKSSLNRAVLSLPAFVTVGLLSYTVYLWHWPVLAFARLLNGRELPDYSVRFGLVLLAFALSAVSFYAFELPVRRKKATGRLVAVLSAVMLALAGTGYVIKNTGGLPQRLGSDDVAFAGQLRNTFPRRTDFCVRTYGFEDRQLLCYAAEGAPASAAVLGDSHAEHLLSGLTAKRENRASASSYLLLGVPSTPPLLDVWRKTTEPSAEKGAVPKQTEALNRVMADGRITTVVLASRWNNFLSGRTFNWKNAPGYDPQDVKQRLAAFEFLLDKTVSALTRAGKNVILVEDVPSFPFTPDSCKRPFREMKNCSVPRSEFDLSVRGANRILESVAARHGGALIYAAWKPFCDAAYCYMVKDNAAYYHDNNHLSDTGSRLAADGLVRLISSSDKGKR